MKYRQGCIKRWAKGGCKKRQRGVERQPRGSKKTARRRKELVEM
jgi:hypothetical protein